MALTKRQFVTAFSVLYLVGLTVLAAVALHNSYVYSLPIANVIGALAVALPPLAGIGLETVISLNERLAAKGQLQTSRIFQTTIIVFIIYETVLATLAGTHISPPGSLTCALRERWQSMFSQKDAEGIQRIQDAFSCCGLSSPGDMAFPFPHGQHDANACMVRYERNTACMEPWKAEEQKVAVMLLVVPLAVFVWKIAILLAPSSGSAWLPSTIRLPGEDGSADGSRAQPKAAITYRDLEDADGGEDDSIRGEVSRLNNDSNLASHVEGGRLRSSGLWRENDVWRDPGERA